MVNGKLALAAAVLGALQLSLCLAAPGPWKAPVVHSVGVVPTVHAVGVVAAPVARPVGVAYVGGFDHDDDGFGDDVDVGARPPRHGFLRRRATTATLANGFPQLQK
nr:uncharacterized protein LOC113813798 [Penaeus vannamei]